MSFRRIRNLFRCRGGFCIIAHGSVSAGLSAVSGSTADSAAVNFAVRSRAATAMSLCLARTPASGKAGYLEVALDPVVNRTGDTWHVCLQGLREIDTLGYGWRADSADISQFYPGGCPISCCLCPQQCRISIEGRSTRNPRTLDCMCGLQHVRVQ